VSSTINIDVALKSAPDPKQNELPKILPNLHLPRGDILVKEKVCNHITSSTVITLTLISFVDTKF